MAITVKPIGNSQITDPSSLVKLIRDTFDDLVDQLNNRAQVYTSTDGHVPPGLNRDDVLIIDYKQNISLLIKNKTGFDKLTAAMLDGLAANSTHFLGIKTAAASPALTDFPNDSDWGFYYSTGGATFYLCFNYNSVLKKVALT